MSDNIHGSPCFGCIDQWSDFQISNLERERNRQNARRGRERERERQRKRWREREREKALKKEMGELRESVKKSSKKEQLEVSSVFQLYCPAGY